MAICIGPIVTVRPDRCPVEQRNVHVQCQCRVCTPGSGTSISTYQRAEEPVEATTLLLARSIRAFIDLDRTDDEDRARDDRSSRRRIWMIVHPEAYAELHLCGTNARNDKLLASRSILSTFRSEDGPVQPRVGIGVLGRPNRPYEMNDSGPIRGGHGIQVQPPWVVGLRRRGPQDR